MSAPPSPYTHTPRASLGCTDMEVETGYEENVASSDEAPSEYDDSREVRWNLCRTEHYLDPVIRKRYSPNSWGVLEGIFETCNVLRGAKI